MVIGHQSSKVEAIFRYHHGLRTHVREVFEVAWKAVLAVFASTGEGALTMTYEFANYIEKAKSFCSIAT